MSSYGDNRFPVPKITSLSEIILDNFKDFINQILIAAALVSLTIGALRYGVQGLTDGTSIIVALVIITVVNSANNYSSERKLRDLIALTEEQNVGVYRNSS